MYAENAAAADLENGGGAVETWPWPADQQLKEKQPFTWLGAAPYIAVVLLGAVLLAVGVAVATYSARNAKQQGGQGQPYHMTAGEEVGTALCVSGTLLAALGILAAAIASDEGCCECNLQRFGPD